MTTHSDQDPNRSKQHFPALVNSDLFWCQAEPFDPEVSLLPAPTPDALLEVRREHLNRVHKSQLIRLLELQETESEVFQASFSQSLDPGYIHRRFPLPSEERLEETDVQEIITSSSSSHPDPIQAVKNGRDDKGSIKFELSSSSKDTFPNVDLGPVIVIKQEKGKDASSPSLADPSKGDVKHPKAEETKGGRRKRAAPLNPPSEGRVTQAHHWDSHLSWFGMDEEFQRQYAELRGRQRRALVNLLGAQQVELRPIWKELQERSTIWSERVWEGSFSMTRGKKGKKRTCSRVSAYARTNRSLKDILPLELEIAELTTYEDIQSLHFSRTNSRFILLRAYPEGEEETKFIQQGLSQRLHQKGAGLIRVQEHRINLFLIPLTRIRPPPPLSPSFSSLLHPRDLAFLGIVRPSDPEGDVLHGEQGGPWEGWSLDMDATWSPDHVAEEEKDTAMVEPGEIIS